MIHFIVTLIQVAAICGCFASSVYYLLCLWSAGALLRERKAARKNARPARELSAQHLPPVSILKPLKGVDPGIYESFRSHCLQDYPEYELIFGVSNPDDPAVGSVKRLQQEFPECRIQLVVCPTILGANIKVSNLVQMLPVAHYAHLIVNDSDIRVESDYLQRVIASLADEKVGMATCLYRGVAASTLGSQLESLGISTDFCAGVLAARQLEGVRFGLGSTMAFRRIDLERIGGFESVVDYLADDYELGRRIAGLGLKVELTDVVVETYLPAYDLRGFFSHQLRWARGVRDSRAGGYIGLVFTFGLMWACLALVALGDSILGWGIAGIILLLRLAVALQVGSTLLGDRYLARRLWLLPLRDLLAVAVWIASFAGHVVTWRGERFELKNGRLIRIG